MHELLHKKNPKIVKCPVCHQIVKPKMIPQTKPIIHVDVVYNYDDHSYEYYSIDKLSVLNIK